jgi:hypothetical protein
LCPAIYIAEVDMPVIAMNQEMGSLGKDVALALSEELGLAQVTHEVVDHVAEKMHVRKSLIRRVLEGRAGMLDRMSTNSRNVSTYVAEEVYELAGPISCAAFRTFPVSGYARRWSDGCSG